MFPAQITHAKTKHIEENKKPLKFKEEIHHLFHKITLPSTISCYILLTPLYWVSYQAVICFWIINCRLLWWYIISIREWHSQTAKVSLGRQGLWQKKTVCVCRIQYKIESWIFLGRLMDLKNWRAGAFVSIWGNSLLMTHPIIRFSIHGFIGWNSY